jgi:hypothetical protein
VFHHKGEEKKMKNIFLLLTLSAICVAGADQIVAKQNANAQMTKEPIRQGSTLQITVTLDRAPNTNGRVFADVGPADGSLPALSTNVQIGKGQTEVSMYGILALDAKLGKWVIRKLSYQPEGGEGSKELTLSGDLSFQVSPHEEVIVPSGAKVTQIK